MRKIALSFSLLALALCIGASAASAGTIFTDLGPPGSVYNCCTGWTVAGFAANGQSFIAANAFTAAIGGAVSQIDLAVGWVQNPPEFYATIWTDVNDLPAVQVPGAFWGNLISTTTFGTSSTDLVTINVSGVNLTAGQSYFMILGPMDINSTGWNAWNFNTQNINGLDLYSSDDGQTWVDQGSQPLGAFDILTGTSVPEPASLLLLGTGLAGIGLASWRRRK